ncbi:MAG: hypothetical protein A2W09_05775 [Deltaproteobacteria bacterium RBG_16_50_11]|nr:MAG: hypothetical protein A2W09_05775 [Deltaproteobacteria bacterium RBG_16_50_11]
MTIFLKDLKKFVKAGVPFQASHNYWGGQGFGQCQFPCISKINRGAVRWSKGFTNKGFTNT